MSDPPMLPFDDEPVRLEPDTTHGVEASRPEPGSVRLQRDLPDAHARSYAVDPVQNVVL